MNICDRPLAAQGLKSYRYPSAYGDGTAWIMIGARDHKDALVEAKRSRPDARAMFLEMWNGERYVAIRTYRILRSHHGHGESTETVVETGLSWEAANAERDRLDAEEKLANPSQTSWTRDQFLIDLEAEWRVK